jgi:hypothetical protein
MKRRMSILVAGCLAILVVGATSAMAQGRADVEVVHASTHDVSPPLDKIPALPPQAGVSGTIPFRPTHPERTPPTSQPDPILQSSPAATQAATTGANFLGLGYGLANFTVQYIPPDTNGAAGDTQFVQWVNASFAVFDKSNGSVLYGPAAGNTFWSGMSGTAGRACSRNNSGDPVAQYDKQNGRWVMMQPVFKSPYYICVAVSTSSDALGSWNRYAFQVPTGLFPDYPKLAVWQDGYYLTYNQFQGNSFVGAAACALDGASMRTGGGATMQCFSNTTGPNNGSLLPADLDGTLLPPSGSPEYFLNYGSDLKSLVLWEFHAVFSNPNNSTFTGSTPIPVTLFSEACNGGACVPQTGTTQQLDSLGDRLMYRLAYRNLGGYESMVVNHSVNTGSGNTGVRWYELRESSPSTPPGSNWTVAQAGTYAPDSSYRWMGSIAQDQAGNMAMGYSVSSGSMSPTIRYSSRAPGDQAGLMGGETDLLSSVAHGSQTSYSRWGDYSSMAIDPTDDCTFWFTTEYQSKTGSAWSTRIASFKFNSCGQAATPDFSVGVMPPSQTVNQGGAAQYTVTISPVGSFTHTVNLSATGLPPGASYGCSPTCSISNGSGTSTMTVTTLASTPTGSYPFKVSATDGTLTHTADVMLVVTSATSGDFAISTSPSSLTVTRGGSSVSYTVTVTGSDGFNGAVSLGVSIPPRTTATFSPNQVNAGDTSTLTITALKSGPTGTYALTITGTSGGLTHSFPVTLAVQ